ncbi:MAG: hypothetical protein EAZ27_11130 [Cytophagales bacterium]|nr:MAG: hypothetical protein EAZ27_11130 [Cytophagales bacterium]
MKKTITLVSSMFAMAAAIIVSTSSCKKDEPTPAMPTVAGAAFDTEVTGKSVFVNVSQDPSAANTGSLYSFESATSGTRCSISTTASFQLQLDDNGNYILTNINKTSASSSTCIGNNTTMPNAATFVATSGITYLTANANDVSTATGFSNSVTVTNGSVVYYKTKAGKNGVMSISLVDDAGPAVAAVAAKTETVYKKMNFSYKTIK